MSKQHKIRITLYDRQMKTMRYLGVNYTKYIRDLIDQDWEKNVKQCEYCGGVLYKGKCVTSGCDK